VTIKRLPRYGLAMSLVLALSAPVFAQVQPVVQNRIPQQVIINGQRVNGAYVASNGGMQTFTCSAPQQYVTPDSASQGWACFDQATNVWLLNALPPSSPAVQQAPAPVQPPTVIYQQPPAVIYQQPIPATVVYTSPFPVIYAPAYPPGVVLGSAAIDAAGRIVSAAILGTRYPRVYYAGPGFRRW
jgi:hypothetical protein